MRSSSLFSFAFVLVLAVALMSGCSGSNSLTAPTVAAAAVTDTTVAKIPTFCKTDANGLACPIIVEPKPDSLPTDSTLIALPVIGNVCADRTVIHTGYACPPMPKGPSGLGGR